MRRFAAIGLPLLAALLLVMILPACDDGIAPPPTPPEPVAEPAVPGATVPEVVPEDVPGAAADASTYNPQTRLADAGDTSSQWNVTDRSPPGSSRIPANPAYPGLTPAQTGPDPALAAFEYPGSTYERTTDLQTARVHHYRTSAPFTTVSAHYTARTDLRGETPDFDKAIYTRTLPTGGNLTITVTGQQTGGTTLTLQVAQ